MTLSITQAMRNAGLDPGSIIADGKIHRFDAPGDRAKSENGWYVLYDGDIQAGRFGSWKTGQSEKWCSKTASEFTPEEKKQYAARMEAARRLREAEAERVHAECREWCEKAWKGAPAATDDHPYLQRKGVPAYGLKLFKDSLMVPVRSLEGGKLQGVQFIYPEKQENGKDKIFKSGTAKQGAMHIIGKPVDDTLIICEGYATGASIHMATGHAVLVAFDAGNLKPVADATRKKQPAWTLIIAADNDRLTAGNPGLTKATAAAVAIGARLAIPIFPGDEGTDFNDLTQISGEDAVKAAIEAAARVEAAPAPDNTTKETPSDQWPEPLPLPEGLPPVKTLAPEMIPVPFRGWLIDIAYRMQSSVDFAATAAIVALGSTIGRGCGIFPKQHDSWLVVPNLFGACIGDPSVMKTPTIAEGTKPLERLEIEAKQEHEAGTQAAEVEQEIEKITRAAICEEIKRAVKKKNPEAIEQARASLADLDNEPPPARRRYQTQDGTTEKIGELLNQNPRGILINRDELIGWFHSLDKAGRESDRGFYLEAWNGTGRFTYDRIGRGTLDVEALCISIFGAITPGPLSDYIRATIRGGIGNDGLLQRFQVMVWPDTATEWVNIDRYPDTEAKNRAFEIFKKLSGDIPGAIREAGASIPALRFTPAGQDIFNQWRHNLETRLRSDHGLHPAMVSHLAKYRSLMPSLALIFHLIEVADGTTEPGPVSERAAAMAAAWCDYLESHAGRVYGGIMSPGIDEAREIVKHIRRGAIQDGATVREVWRHQWARLTSSEEVKSGLNILTEYDWLTVEKVTTGHRPSEIIRLNPKTKL